MNLEHLRAVLWLRWRMSVNQLRRGGIANTIILALLGVLVFCVSLGMFFVALVVSMATLRKASAEVVMYVWDGVVAAFLIFWLIGLLAELQRAEVLSLEKLLHLPISLAGTFLINYIGSVVSLSLVIFFPAMVGLSIGLVFAKGPAMCVLFLPLAGFLFMVTAITHQFQGWLAVLMANQRRRRTVITVVTICFILIVQLPNLANLVFSRTWGRNQGMSDKQSQELTQLDQALAAGEIDAEQHDRERARLLNEYQTRTAEHERRLKDRIQQITERVNLMLPVGWLPYGAMACVRGNMLPACLGALGAALIGTVSLWRSYRTTLGLYTGQFTSGKAQSEPGPTAAEMMPTRTGLLERQLPGLSEHAAAVALANFRSLTRAPESKMLLLTPVILVIVFGSMVFTGAHRPPELARPFVGFAAVAMIMLSMMQLIGNQFGFDRAGFRVLVLSGSPRREILLGKNLSVGPLAIGMATVSIAVLQAVYPMRTDHMLATLAQQVTVFLILSTVGNLTSILVPMPVAPGSLKPAHPKAITVLVQLLFLLLFPPVLALALIPLGLELLLHHLGWLRGVPVYLIASFLGLFIVCWIYRQLVGWQGQLLQAREQKILVVVTSKVE